MFNATAYLSTRLQETFANIRIIKCFGSDNFELIRLKNSIDDSSDAMKKETQISIIEPEARKLVDAFAEGLIIFVSLAITIGANFFGLPNPSGLKGLLDTASLIGVLGCVIGGGLIAYGAELGVAFKTTPTQKEAITAIGVS